MKLSDRNKTIGEILGWKKKKVDNIKYGIFDAKTQEQCDKAINNIINEGYNTALTSCDHEIDREALAKVLCEGEFKRIKWESLMPDGLKEIFYDRADLIISTMPTWLKPTERK